MWQTWTTWHRPIIFETRKTKNKIHSQIVPTETENKWFYILSIQFLFVSTEKKICSIQTSWLRGKWKCFFFWKTQRRKYTNTSLAAKVNSFFLLLFYFSRFVVWTQSHSFDCVFQDDSALQLFQTQFSSSPCCFACAERRIRTRISIAWFSWIGAAWSWSWSWSRLMRIYRSSLTCINGLMALGMVYKCKAPFDPRCVA